MKNWLYKDCSTILNYRISLRQDLFYLLDYRITGFRSPFGEAMNNVVVILLHFITKTLSSCPDYCISKPFGIALFYSLFTPSLSMQCKCGRSKQK